MTDDEAKEVIRWLTSLGLRVTQASRIATGEIELTIRLPK